MTRKRCTKLIYSMYGTEGTHLSEIKGCVASGVISFHAYDIYYLVQRSLWLDSQGKKAEAYSCIDRATTLAEKRGCPSMVVDHIQTYQALIDIT